MTFPRTHWFRSLALLLGGFLVAGLFGTSFAAPFQPTISMPKSFADVQKGLKEIRDNVAGVQCGGWFDLSAQVNGMSVQGNVPLPNVSADIPGRKNMNALAKPGTGVGERGEFEFPDTAFGFMSACNTADFQRQDGYLKERGIDVIWTNDLENIDEEASFDQVPGTGLIQINPGGWCRLTSKATPRWCEKLFNAWLALSRYMDENNLRQQPSPLCPDPPKHYFCFDFTSTCKGQQCRTLNPPGFSTELSECEMDANGNVIILKQGHLRVSQSSFYRHYGNEFSSWEETKQLGQSPLNVTSAAGQQWNLRGECYEYYKEDDPKDTVTDASWQQCEIVVKTPNEDRPDKPEWRDPGEENGEVLKQRSDHTKPANTEENREQRTGPEPWVPDPETNLWSINIEKLKEQQKNLDDPADITGILGTILEVKEKGSKTGTGSYHVDMNDDSDHRAVSEYWEAQQTELLKILSLQTIKILMPARVLLGLSADDPIFRYVRGVVSKSNGIVEVTLHGGLEDLGIVLTSFRRNGVAPIEEVRIPILIPIISELQIDLRISDLELWKQRQQIEGKGTGAADELIDTLRSYKARKADIGKMSAVLARTLGRLFRPYEDIRKYYTEWFDQNARLIATLEEKDAERTKLQEKWREAQDILLKIDECALDWCSNQRYSLAIYSLLDQMMMHTPEGQEAEQEVHPWWGDKYPGEPRNHEFEPRLIDDGRKHDLRDLGYQPPPDLTFDFSSMEFATGSLKIPVLWPIQIALKLPNVPLVGAELPDPSLFPDLPPIPNEEIFDDFQIPEVDLPPLPTIPTPSLPQFTEAIKIVDEIIDRFAAMGAAYCPLPPSITTPPDKEQKSGRASKLIHIENQMKEVVGRVFSRWLPNRGEDMAGRVVRLREDASRGKNYPCEEGVICYPLPPEIETVVKFKWFLPSFPERFTEAGDFIRNMTMPGSEQQNPFESAPIPTLERLFPLLKLPTTIDLFIPPPPPQQ